MSLSVTLIARAVAPPRRHTTRPIRRGQRFAVISVVLCLVQGCASHRNRPPQCKGPYTPINQSPVASDGPQR